MSWLDENNVFQVSGGVMMEGHLPLPLNHLSPTSPEVEHLTSLSSPQLS